jgi:hypothetical protein
MFGFYDDPASLYGDPTDDPGMGTFDALALRGLTPMPRQAAPLRQPPPKRLTTEELAAFLDKAGTEPSRPAPLTGIGQLSGEDLKQARLGSLWAGLSALGTGVSGHWDRAAAQGIPAIQEAQDRAVAGANARQQAGYETSLADFKSKQADQQQKAVVGGLMGYLNDIYDAEPPGSPFVARAEQAAKMGDMGTIEKMAQAEPERRLMWAHGKNPDGPTALEDQQQLQARLHDLIKKTSLQTLSGPEAEAAALKAKAEQDARLPGEMKLKMAPSYQAPPQYEPLSRVAARTELVQGIEDKHAALREAAKQGTSIPGKLGQAPSGEWGWISPPTPANPAPTFTPIDGQPKKAGGLQHFQREGTPYVWNPSKPELGAIEVPVHQAGDKGAPTMLDLTAPPPRPAPKLGIGGQGPSRRPIPGGTPAPPPAAPPASAQDATKKLGGVRDPGLQKRIGAARAAGYSDSEIASFLGIH